MATAAPICYYCCFASNVLLKELEHHARTNKAKVSQRSAAVESVHEEGLFQPPEAATTRDMEQLH